MRRVIALALPALLLALPAARAQHWNDSGPGRDLLSSTVTDFEAFRQRTPAAPSAAAPGVAGPMGQAQPRAPIPILDWVPPPQTQPAPRSTTRRTTTRRASPPRDPAPARLDPAPVSAPRATGSETERTLAERERELERLRRILEEDRLRYERSRQPQLQ
jgi:hypothetical protein